MAFADVFVASSGDESRLIDSSGTTNAAEMMRLYRRQVEAMQMLSRRRVAVPLVGSALGYATLAALEHLAADVFVLEATTANEDCRAMARELDIEAIVDPRDDDDTAQLQRLDDVRSSESNPSVNSDGTITILTSGTTGRPKAARHTWHSLARPVRRAGTRQTWLLAYRPHLYAGLQVALQAFRNDGTLVVPDLDGDASHIAAMMRDTQVAYASATPSYWRQLLLFAPESKLRAIPLRQITIGGEIVDQNLLDRLAEQFPQARIAHIYATTELGRCFSVTDCREGFPAEWLQQPLPDGVQLKLSEGQLFVRSANAMSGYNRDAADLTTQWWATGDFVQQAGDRILFIGREGDMINVGGNKVSPVAVEQVIRQVDGVKDVRVWGKSSSIAGEIVACDVVAGPQHDLDQLRQTISNHCNTRLARYQVPRFFQFVDQIAMTQSMKRQH